MKIADLEQILPPPSLLNARIWRQDNALFHQQLAQQGNNPLWYCRNFNPYPLAVSGAAYNQQKSLQAALYAAILALVGNYFTDHRLREIIALPLEVERLLADLQATEPDYQPGAYRPDFLYDQDGTVQICEINARFPVNGYLITHYLNENAKKLPYFQRKGSLPEADFQYLNGPTSNSILAAFTARLCHGGVGKICLLKDSEKGWDVHFINYELKKIGLTVERFNGTTLPGTDNKADSGIVLELHQHEILAEKTFAKIAGLTKIVPQSLWLNDLRTVFLVHDKRFLALFQRPDILLNYLSQEQINLLSRHVAETHVVALAPQKVAEAKEQKDQWLLKPNLLGKGEGILFGSKLSLSQWQSALEDLSHGQYVLQRKIEQKQFSIWHGHQYRDPVYSEMNVVGTLLCLDDKYLGPGIFRASSGDIVNVAGGGTILTPLLV